MLLVLYCILYQSASSSTRLTAWGTQDSIMSFVYCADNLKLNDRQHKGDLKGTSSTCKPLNISCTMFQA